MLVKSVLIVGVPVGVWGWSSGPTETVILGCPGGSLTACVTASGRTWMVGPNHLQAPGNSELRVSPGDIEDNGLLLGLHLQVCVYSDRLT